MVGHATKGNRSLSHNEQGSKKKQSNKVKRSGYNRGGKEITHNKMIRSNNMK